MKVLMYGCQSEREGKWSEGVLMNVPFKTWDSIGMPKP